MPLNPQPYREVKRKLEAAGFREHCQKGGHVKFVRDTPRMEFVQAMNVKLQIKTPKSCEK